jgi:hypothetical protein
VHASPHQVETLSRVCVNRRATAYLPRISTPHRWPRYAPAHASDVRKPWDYGLHVVIYGYETFSPTFLSVVSMFLHFVHSQIPIMVVAQIRRLRSFGSRTIILCFSERLIAFA